METNLGDRRLTSDSAKILTRISQEELGMPFHFHPPRYTHCTRLAEYGVDIQLAQERLGHKKLSTTQEIYKHITPKF